MCQVAGTWRTWVSPKRDERYARYGTTRVGPGRARARIEKKKKRIELNDIYFKRGENAKFEFIGLKIVEHDYSQSRRHRDYLDDRRRDHWGNRADLILILDHFHPQ